MIDRSNDWIGVIDGGAGDDTLRGTSGRDRIDGNSGSDTIFGLGGDDRLWGDSTGTDTQQHDSLYAGGGNDDVIGGPGTNSLYAWSQDPQASGGQFGVFVDNAGNLHGASSVDLDLDDAAALSNFTGLSLADAAAINIETLSLIAGLTFESTLDVDQIHFSLDDDGLPSDTLTLEHNSGLGILRFEILDAAGNVLRSGDTSENSTVDFNLDGLDGDSSYTMRITAWPTAEGEVEFPLGYQILTNVGDDAGDNASINLSLTPEDTGLNRILGGAQQDSLYGGTGLDFLYGNGNPEGPVSYTHLTLPTIYSV